MDNIFLIFPALFILQTIFAIIPKLSKVIYIPITILLLIDLLLKIIYLFVGTFYNKIAFHSELYALHRFGPFLMFFLSIYISTFIFIIIIRLFFSSEKKSQLFKINHKNNIIFLVVIFVINFFALLFFLFLAIFEKYLPSFDVYQISSYILIFSSIFSIGFFVNNIINWIKRKKVRNS